MTAKKNTTTESKTLEESTSNEKVSKKQPKQVVYVGPTIPGVIKTNTIFNNGIDERVAERIMIQPELGGLLIDINNLSDAQRQIALKKGAYYSLYSKVKNSLKEE
ncbi:hypothetical protein SAMN02746066_03407 [Anaerosporobacter mobilis DSM 15930]|jgi:hypothetical protein|uniref:Uncharacterized protein n=1 Tax=Anaerosporobacter mobilis DSM 15930 TaxID=1120996 RepID=A0A1M7LU96_9FIRM|nr:hypothetical protein [Anaerosporobacter mobilis]SHM81793.1 hypothetical protein SAMN02746066_03407 [Anaerosporobacter mobilis DSM 15930]